jgi:hypothetical protein
MTFPKGVNRISKVGCQVPGSPGDHVWTGPYPGFFLGVPSSTEGARIEAPRGVGCGKGVSPPR